MEPSPGLLSRRAVDVIKWTEDWAERVGEGGMILTSSSEAVVSNDRLLGLRIPGLGGGGSLSFLAWPVETVGGTGESDTSWLSTWITGVELRSSVTIEGVSHLLPWSILWWAETREENPGEGGGGSPTTHTE